MWQIDHTFEDLIHFRKKSSLHLNADQQIDPYHISYPILWTGYLNNEEIIVKQINDSSFHITDYEFVKYPDKYDYLQGEIVRAIDKYLKILD